MGYINGRGRGQLIEGVAQGGTAILVGAEGQVDVGAGPVAAHGAGPLELHPMHLGELFLKTAADLGHGAFAEPVAGRCRLRRFAVRSVLGLCNSLFH